MSAEPGIIRIDRSLVDGISSSRALRSIVTGFVLLAPDSGASLVAEGVETPEDLRVLAGLGVDAAQGYLLPRPGADPGDLARWHRPRTCAPGTSDRASRLVLRRRQAGRMTLDAPTPAPAPQPAWSAERERLRQRHLDLLRQSQEAEQRARTAERAYHDWLKRDPATGRHGE